MDRYVKLMDIDASKLNKCNDEDFHHKKWEIETYLINSGYDNIYDYNLWDDVYDFRVDDYQIIKKPDKFSHRDNFSLLFREIFRGCLVFKNAAYTVNSLSDLKRFLENSMPSTFYLIFEDVDDDYIHILAFSKYNDIIGLYSYFEPY